MSDKSCINKSFLIDGKKVSLGMYLDMDVDEFCSTYDKNEQEYIELIKGNFHSGEKPNTRPTIFFLMRDSQRGVDQTFEAIHQMDQEGKLSIPLKAFFGRNKSRSGTSKEVNLVVFNRNKINSRKSTVSIYGSIYDRKWDNR